MGIVLRKILNQYFSILIDCTIVEINILIINVININLFLNHIILLNHFNYSVFDTKKCNNLHIKILF